MKLKLTDAKVRAVNPPATGRTELSDSDRPGLRFRITSFGATTWLYQKQIKGGVRRGFTLGSYPAITLSRARALALEIQIEAERGYDRVLAAAEDSKRVQSEALASRSVQEILEIYIATHINQELKPGQAREERKRQLRTHLKAHFIKPIDSLSRLDLQQIVDAKQAEGKVVMANRIRAAVAAFTHWAYRRGHMLKNVGEAVQKAGKEVARKRTPSLAEVQEIWAASFQMGDLWGPFFRMCILTGQRSRSDVLAMKWAWIDFDKHRYEVPDPKNGLPHIVHLSDVAVEELQHLRLLQEQADEATQSGKGKIASSFFVFSTTGTSAASGVSRAKLRLDAAITQARLQAGNEEPFPPWVLHDLRRSQATALAEAGFDEGVVDRIQNHVAGSSRASAVAAVYNKARKLPERARALDAWAAMIVGHGNQDSKIVALNKGIDPITLVSTGAYENDKAS